MRTGPVTELLDADRYRYFRMDLRHRVTTKITEVGAESLTDCHTCPYCPAVVDARCGSSSRLHVGGLPDPFEFSAAERYLFRYLLPVADHGPQAAYPDDTYSLEGVERAAAKAT